MSNTELELRGENVGLRQDLRAKGRDLAEALETIIDLNVKLRQRDSTLAELSLENARLRERAYAYTEPVIVIPPLAAAQLMDGEKPCPPLS